MYEVGRVTWGFLEVGLQQPFPRTSVRKSDRDRESDGFISQHYDKTPEIFNLRRGKVSFDSGLQLSQPPVAWPCAFRPVVRRNTTGETVG